MSADVADTELIHENVFAIKKFKVKYMFRFLELHDHILREYNQHYSFIDTNNLIHALECLKLLQ